VTGVQTCALPISAKFKIKAESVTVRTAKFKIKAESVTVRTAKFKIKAASVTVRTAKFKIKAKSVTVRTAKFKIKELHVSPHHPPPQYPLALYTPITKYTPQCTPIYPANRSTLCSLRSTN
jgi:hypothetical protein